MTRRPETRYAWNGDVALAFQVFGTGPVDLVYLQGYTSHVDLNWESPHLARFLRGLGERARVIHTDRRGWGCSDRFSPGRRGAARDPGGRPGSGDGRGGLRAGRDLHLAWTPVRPASCSRRRYPERDGRPRPRAIPCSPSTTARRRAGSGSRSTTGCAGSGARRPGTTTSHVERRARAPATGSCRGAARASPRGRWPPSPTRSAPSTSDRVLSSIHAPDARGRAGAEPTMTSSARATLGLRASTRSRAPA